MILDSGLKMAGIIISVLGAQKNVTCNFKKLDVKMNGVCIVKHGRVRRRNHKKK